MRCSFSASMAPFACEASARDERWRLRQASAHTQSRSHSVGLGKIGLCASPKCAVRSRCGLAAPQASQQLPGPVVGSWGPRCPLHRGPRPRSRAFAPLRPAFGMLAYLGHSNRCPADADLARRRVALLCTCRRTAREHNGGATKETDQLLNLRLYHRAGLPHATGEYLPRTRRASPRVRRATLH